MSSTNLKLFSLNELSDSELECLFSLSHFFKKQHGNSSVKTFQNSPLKGLVAILAFLEPSTRTRISFEMAAQRLGLHCIGFQASENTSAKKGETDLDSLQTLLAMEPDLLVHRSEGHKSLREEIQRNSISTINAGFGSQLHPTQALLDCFTLNEMRGNTKLKVLFVGDLRHSRVVQSNLDLMLRLGYEVKQCAPTGFLLDNEKLQPVESLSDGLGWCDVVMSLRWQKERHQKIDLSINLDSFQLNRHSVSALKNDGIIMHPGPQNRGVEITDDVMRDSRCVILDQVKNGVFARMAVIAWAFGLKEKDFE